MQQREQGHIRDEFRRRQTRQFFAIAVTLLLLLSLVLFHTRPDLFGRELSRGEASLAQLAVIAAFGVFSVINWRCPSCNKYLGANIYRRECGRCGSRLC